MISELKQWNKNVPCTAADDTSPFLRRLGSREWWKGAAFQKRLKDWKPWVKKKKKNWRHFFLICFFFLRFLNQGQARLEAERLRTEEHLSYVNSKFLFFYVPIFWGKSKMSTTFQGIKFTSGWMFVGVCKRRLPAANLILDYFELLKDQFSPFSLPFVVDAANTKCILKPHSLSLI